MKKFSIMFEAENGSQVVLGQVMTAEECIEWREDGKAKNRPYVYVIDNETSEILDWREIRKISKK